MISMMLITPNVFDLRTVLLAKHAQHVVLIHFPIALFTTGVVFDWIGSYSKRPALMMATYYNLLAAAISTLPVIATGILAWQLQLEGQKLKGLLLMHLVFGGTSGAMIWLAWWLHFRARQGKETLAVYRFAIESMGVAVVILTGHLGGFLSGVNIPS
jgi:uncharacterized membrane protein